MKYLIVILFLIDWISTLTSIDFGSHVLKLPPKKMKVCDNIIVDDIPGKNETVMKAGQLYLEGIANNSQIKPFGGEYI
jgi:hypothetical protein